MMRLITLFVVLIAGLVKLAKLRRLDISGNYLSALEAGNFDKLQSLVYLSLENNK